jgi:hypothetical protein
MTIDTRPPLRFTPHRDGWHKCHQCKARVKYPERHRGRCRKHRPIMETDLRRPNNDLNLKRIGRYGKRKGRKAARWARLEEQARRDMERADRRLRSPQ